MLFDNYIVLIIQNSNIEDIQNDTVNLYNILEPISYLWTIDYPSYSSLLIQELESCFQFFSEIFNWENEASKIWEVEVIKCIKKTWWSIILASEFVKKSQEQRNKLQKYYATQKSIDPNGIEIDTKIGDTLSYDISLCKPIFAISQLYRFAEESNIKRSLMIFFKSFTDTYLLDIETPAETTKVLWEGISISI